MAFRRQYKQASYTYSQCDVPLDVLDKFLREKAGKNFGWHLIVSADHAETTTDENKHCGVHRHVHEEYSKKPNIANSRHWDIEVPYKEDHVHIPSCVKNVKCVYHPHIEKVKHRTKHIQYCLDQETGRVLSGTLNDLPVDLDSLIQAHNTKQSYGWHYVATLIKEGKSINDIDSIAPGFVANNKRKLIDYDQYQKVKKIQMEPLLQWRGLCVDDFDSIPKCWQKVIQWIRKNFDGDRKRDPRQNQLWLHGAKRMCKSYFWSQILNKYFRRYDWNTEEKYQDLTLWDADYIFFDEFCGGVTMQKLKLIAQMYGFKVPVKGVDPIMFTKNIPIIVVTNEEPNDVYHRSESVLHKDSVFDRFDVICIDEPFWLHVVEGSLLQDPLILDVSPVERYVVSDPLAVDLSFRQTNFVSRSTSPVREITPPNLIRQNAIAFTLDPQDEDEDMSTENSDDSEWTEMEKIRRKNNK
jgi:hypothetical protein